MVTHMNDDNVICEFSFIDTISVIIKQMYRVISQTNKQTITHSVRKTFE